jgi:hypothetical protein
MMRGKTTRYEPCPKTEAPFWKNGQTNKPTGGVDWPTLDLGKIAKK